MLAKCSRCSQTFQTDRYGEQQCPFCGAAVAIAPPNAPPAAMIAPPAVGEIPQDQSAPVDDPAAHGGWISALVKTWRMSMFEPQAFFSRMKAGPGWGGPFIFAAVCTVIAGPFVGLNTALTLVLQMKNMGDQLPQFAEMWHQVSGYQVPFFIGWAVCTPILGLLGLFFNAGLYHLALIIVGGNKAGFTATMRATALSAGPYLLGIVPFCGSSIAGIWMLILPVYTLSQLHRITLGRSVGALVTTWALSCCCIGLPVGGVGGLAAMSYVQKAQASGKHLAPLPPMDDLPDNP